MRLAVFSLFLLSMAATGFSVGCSTGRGDPSLVSDDPARKLPAMREAVKKDSDKDIPQLISELENSDPAIRMFAIRTLEKMTGETRGYRFHDPEAVRAVAVRSWQQAFNLPVDPPRTLAVQPTTGPTTAPMTRPATTPTGLAGSEGGVR